MRTPTLIGVWSLVGATLACSPLRQPLGTLAPPTTMAGAAGSRGAAGAAGGTSGSSGGSATAIGPQIPSLPPEWGACNPKVYRCYQDSTLSPSSQASGLFTGTANPDPAAKPTIVYPLPGSMHPINLADITFQWRRGPAAAQTVFRIRLRRADGATFEFYVPCNHAGAGPGVDDVACVYHLPPGAWLDLATSSRGGALTVDLAGVDPSAPGIVATSDPLMLSFSPEDVRGGLTYWSSSVVGMVRLLFGARAALPFVAANTPSNQTTCGSCHSVSRDGSTIAFTQGEAAGQLRVAATATPERPLFPPATTHDSATLALNHDGSRVLVSYSGRLFLRDTATGAEVAEVPNALLGAPLRGFHPEWSPDDTSIALTLSAQGESDWSVATGAIGVLPFNKNAATGEAAFGPVEVLVDTGAEFNFYPTWSPDGRWLAFATAPVAPTQTSYIQNAARLRLVNRATHAVSELANATWKAGRTTTWPKFAPTVQPGGLMFLTFNAKLDYGFLRPANVGGVPQLWMTSIDPSKLVTGGGDASTPPVWLPFQDVDQRAYLGCWSERVGCRLEAGRSVGCGAGELCVAGACAMNP